MNDCIYVIDCGNEIMLLNLNTLQWRTIVKNDLRKHDARIQIDKDFATNIPYISALRPVVDKQHLRLTIIPSFACNYSCNYCYQIPLKGNKERLLPNNVPKIRYFCEMYCKLMGQREISEISIFGGEPLLPQNKETLQEIFRLWRDSNYIITTNGRYILEYSDLFHANKGRKIAMKVSVDGTKQIHYKRKLKFLCGGGCARGIMAQDGNVFKPNCAEIQNQLFHELPALFRKYTREYNKRA